MDNGISEWILMEFRNEYQQPLQLTKKMCARIENSFSSFTHFSFPFLYGVVAIHPEIPLLHSEIPLFHPEIPLTNSLCLAATLCARALQLFFPRCVQREK